MPISNVCARCVTLSFLFLESDACRKQIIFLSIINFPSVRFFDRIEGGTWCAGLRHATLRNGCIRAATEPLPRPRLVDRPKFIVPRRVRRVGDKSPVEIRCAIGPPHRTTLSQRALCRIDGCASVALCFGVVCLQGGAHLAARSHELFDEFLPQIRCEIGIAHAPEASSDHEVAPVGRAWMFRGGRHSSTIGERDEGRRTPAEKNGVKMASAGQRSNLDCSRCLIGERDVVRFHAKERGARSSGPRPSEVQFSLIDCGEAVPCEPCRLRPGY
jgi:hypothetical protein